MSRRRRKSSIDICLRWFEDQALFLPPTEADLYRQAYRDHEDFDMNATAVGRFQSQHGKVQLIALLWKHSQGRHSLSMSNWKRRYVVITDRELLYAATNPLLSPDKQSIKCAIPLTDIVSVETVDHSIFGHAWVVCVQHSHALHIDCNGISPSVFISVLKRNLKLTEDTKTAVVDGFIEYRYSPTSPRIDKETQLNTRHLSALHENADVVVLLDLAYLHNVDDWDIKLGLAWSDIQRAIAQDKADRLPDYVLIVPVSELPQHSVVYLSTPDKISADEATAIAQRSELRDAWVAGVVQQHVGTDASWRLETEGPTTRVWVYTTLLAKSCPIASYKQWLQDSRFIIMQACSSFAVWDGWELRHLEQCPEELAKVDDVLRQTFPQETSLSSRLSLSKSSELGLLRPKCEVYAQDPVCQLEMTLAKASGLKFLLPLRKPSLSWRHPSGVTFAAPFKWAVQASLQIVKGLGHDESALHNPAEFTGFSPTDLLEHAFASPGVDFEGSLYWLILSGAIVQWFQTPVLAQHCRCIAQAAEVPSLQETETQDPTQSSSHATLAFTAALELTSEPCDQLHVLLVCLMALQQQCPVHVAGGKGMPLLQWLQQVFSADSCPSWLRDTSLDLQADLQCIERLSADSKGTLYWLSIGAAVNATTRSIMGELAECGLVLAQGSEGLELLNGFTVVGSKALAADWSVAETLRRVSLSEGSR
eukprot:m.74750 g.74750  ORF g.74750 m.74750 type:complete len:705 (-) comp14377_c0_seq1:143-2257(-)